MNDKQCGLILALDVKTTDEAAAFLKSSTAPLPM